MEITEKHRKNSIIKQHTLLLEEFESLREHHKQIKKIHKKIIKNFNKFSESISKVIPDLPNLNIIMDEKDLKEVDEIYEMLIKDENDGFEYETTEDTVIDYPEKDIKYDPLDIEIKILESEIILNEELQIKEDIEYLESTDEEKDLDIEKYIEEINDETNHLNHFDPKNINYIKTPIYDEKMEGCIDTSDIAKREKLINKSNENFNIIDRKFLFDLLSKNSIHKDYRKES